MSIFVKSGNDWIVVNAPKDDILEGLPPGNYAVARDDRKGFFLQKADDFTLPAKTYGNEIKRSKRVIQTFLERPNGTGILLTGEKGSGKTLLTKKIAIELAEMGIPTLLVNQEFTKHITDFISFVQAIEQPAAILFDEFEKNYNRDEQQKLLTLFDGVVPSKKLFMLTINDLYKMDDFMLNRPGRFYYLFRYIGLSEDAIQEYCDEKLVDMKQLKHIKSFAKMFQAFTFDMLSSIVEEMNRYGETLDEVLQYMNVSFADTSKQVYEIVTLNVADEDIVSYGDVNYGSAFNPLRDKFLVYYSVREDGGEEEAQHKYFDPNSITKIEKDGVMTFKKGDQVLVLRPKKRADFNYKDLTTID